MQDDPFVIRKIDRGKIMLIFGAENTGNTCFLSHAHLSLPILMLININKVLVSIYNQINLYHNN